MAELNFDALFNAASMEMHSAFERSLASFRPDERGGSREDAVRRFFEDWLPDEYGISKGYVVDNSIVSKECDIVIFNKARCPKFYLSKQNDLRIFPIAYVYCTIEVKSKLNRKELDNALGKIASINAVHQEYMRKNPQKQVFKDEINLLLADYESLHEGTTAFENLSSFKKNNFSGYKGISLKEKKYSDRPIRIIFCFDIDEKLSIEEIKSSCDSGQYLPEIIFSLKHGTIFKLSPITLSRFYSMERNIQGSEYLQYSTFALLDYAFHNPKPGSYHQSIKENMASKNLMFFYALLMDFINHHFQSPDIDPIADIVAIWQSGEEE